MSAVSTYINHLRERHEGTSSPADVGVYTGQEVSRAERIVLYVVDSGFAPITPYDTRPNRANIRETAYLEAWKSCTDSALEGALTAVKDLLIAEAAFVSVYNPAGVARAGYGNCIIEAVKMASGAMQAHGVLQVWFDLGIADSAYTPLDEISVVTQPITRIRSFGDIAFERDIR